MNISVLKYGIIFKILQSRNELFWQTSKLVLGSLWEYVMRFMAGLLHPPNFSSWANCISHHALHIPPWSSLLKRKTMLPERRWNLPAGCSLWKVTLMCDRFTRLWHSVGFSTNKTNKNRLVKTCLSIKSSFDGYLLLFSEWLLVFMLLPQDRLGNLFHTPYGLLFF